MQPSYLYSPDFDREIQWRSKFSIIIPIIIGFIQMILTFAIIGLEIASVVISPIRGTLYAGFWLSVIFIFSWISMFTLVCCHRSRKCATYVFLIQILCVAAAIALIVLDAFFIGNITRCFFADSICKDLQSSYTRPSLIPLGRKVQVLKGQLAMVAALLATALLYMLLFILASISSRRAQNRVLMENPQRTTHPVSVHQSGKQIPPPPQTWTTTSVPATYEPPSVPLSGKQSPPPPPHAWKSTTIPATYDPASIRPSDTEVPPQTWKSTSVPVTYEPSQIECPHCQTSIRLAQKKQ